MNRLGDVITLLQANKSQILHCEILKIIFMPIKVSVPCFEQPLPRMFFKSFLKIQENEEIALKGQK